MNHQDHVALIRGGVEGAGPSWLELGCGEGAFTLALADVLGANGGILAVDRDRSAVGVALERVVARYPTISIRGLGDDFAKAMPDGPFDGVLAANSLHFVRDRKPVLAAIRRVLRPAGRLVIVEYDADTGNPWVPYPFSFDRWRYEATAAGFEEVELLHRVPSRFLGGIYGAVATSAAPSGGLIGGQGLEVVKARATLPPHGRDREE